MPNANPLHQAYERTALQREGISFDAAIANPMFKRCLERIAELNEHIKQPPLPRHATAHQWQQFKD